MKSILLFSIITILLTACGINKKDRIEEPIAITYLAQSRGYYYKVKLTNTEIRVDKDDLQTNVFIKKIDAKTWDEFWDIIKTIKVTKMKNFKAPSQASRVDRAAIAVLKIEFSRNSYKSDNFDHKAPPKELKQLIDKILALAETVE